MTGKSRHGLRISRLAQREIILDRWPDHFEELLNHPLHVDDQAHTTQPTKHAMAKTPWIEKVSGVVANLNSVISPGMDGVGTEIYYMWWWKLHSYINRSHANLRKDKLSNKIRNPPLWLFCTGLEEVKDLCGNSRSIALLSVVDEVLCRIILDHQLTNIAVEILPESQCCVRHARDGVDMIFFLRGNYRRRV